MLRSAIRIANNIGNHILEEQKRPDLNNRSTEGDEMFKGVGRIGICVPWPPDISR